MRIDRTTLARLPPVDAAAHLGAAVQLGDLAIDAALDMARELRFPEEIQAALARAIAPPPGATAASLRAGFFVPVPGKEYRIELAEPQPKGHAFDVRYGMRLARAMLAEGLKIDRASGQILDARGRSDPRCPISLARQLFTELTGREAPPWILLHPEARSFYWPKGQVELELGTHTITPRGKTGVKFVFAHRFDDTAERARLWTAAELAPLSDGEWSPKSRQAFGVTFEASSSALIERAKQVFDRVVGPAAEKWRDRERQLLLESAKILADPSSVELAKELSGTAKHEPWTIEDARNVLTARLDELARILAPVKVVVVPAGKHYSSMPHVAHIRKALRDRSALGDAATLVLQDREAKGYVRLVLIAEEDLVRDGKDAKHELYHLLEDRYLSSETVAKIEQIWSRTVRRGGPFSRAYGMQREEFFTTMSEEFEGAHGEEGRSWLKKNHRDLWEIFENVTRHLVH